MKRKKILLFAVLIAGVNAAQAFDMGDMMDPGEWFGGGNDRDYYDRGYYGGGYGPYGWGGGPYGYGYGGYPGAFGVPSQGTAAQPRIPE